MTKAMTDRERAELCGADAANWHGWFGRVLAAGRSAKEVENAANEFMFAACAAWRWAERATAEAS